MSLGFSHLIFLYLGARQGIQCWIYWMEFLTSPKWLHDVYVWGQIAHLLPWPNLAGHSLRINCRKLRRKGCDWDLLFRSGSLFTATGKLFRHNLYTELRKLFYIKKFWLCKHFSGKILVAPPLKGEAIYLLITLSVHLFVDSYKKVNWISKIAKPKICLQTFWATFDYLTPTLPPSPRPFGAWSRTQTDRKMPPLGFEFKHPVDFTSF